LIDAAREEGEGRDKKIQREEKEGRRDKANSRSQLTVNC